MSHDTPRDAPGTGVAEYLGMLGVLGLLVVLFGLLSEHFFTRLTLATLANQVPALTVIAVGMTFVLVVAGIDLSVGSVLALGGGGARGGSRRVAVDTGCGCRHGHARGAGVWSGQRVRVGVVAYPVVHRDARHAGGGARRCLPGDRIPLRVHRCEDGVNRGAGRGHRTLAGLLSGGGRGAGRARGADPHGLRTLCDRDRDERGGPCACRVSTRAR